MSFAGQNYIQGTLTSAGTPTRLNLGFVPTYFRLWNETAFDSTANPGVTKQGWWNYGMAAGEAFTIRNTNGAATDQSDFLTTGGFTTYSGVGEVLGSALATSGTDITQANPAVVTVTSHGLATGDVVRLYGTTGMLQVSGIDYVVTVVNANSFTIPVNSSGFAAVATAGFIRQVIVPQAFTPRDCVITNITAANPGVITTSVNHGYSAGEIIRILVPSGWGMTEANGKQVKVVSVTANTITTDLDTSAFTAFAYPTSAVAAVGTSFPQTVPIGDQATVLTGATNNTSYAGIYLGTSVCGAASDVIYYEAAYAPIYS